MTPAYRPYRVEITGELGLLSPLHVGSGERLALSTDAPILLDPATTSPYIPGTSLRGALRDHLEREAHFLGCDIDSIHRVFGKTPLDEGDSSWAGQLAVLDCYSNLREGVREIRDHVRINREWSAAAHGAKFDGEVVLSGVSFHFGLIYEGESDDAELELLREAVRVLESGDLTLGAKAGWGYGRLQLTKTIYRVYDRLTDSGLATYLSARLGSPATPVATLPGERAAPQSGYVRRPSSWLKFKLRLHCAGPVLVKAPIPPTSQSGGDPSNPETYAEAGLWEADHVSLSRAGDGHYYLPGSSLRGVLRSQGERICRTLGNNAAEILFGVAKAGPGGRRGLIEISDGELVDHPQLLFLDHVAIDRITAAAVDAKKFSSSALVSPKFEVSVRVHFDSSQHEAIALWGFVLRDLMMGRLWIGSGVTRGYGYVESTEIVEMSGGLIGEFKLPYQTAVENHRHVFRTGSRNFQELQWLWDAVQPSWGASG